MIERNIKRSMGLCGIVTYGLLSSTSAFAQQEPRDPEAVQHAEQSEEFGDIVVTARKRNETAIDVPVAMTAFGKAELDKYGTRDLLSLATQVPGLVIQPLASGSGGTVSLRGVSSPPSAPAIDQAISFNVDGVQVGSANIMRLAQIDLQQVEVLKGPQALFFGKNSPGGVISLRSADPGDHFEAIATASYEAEASEKTAQLVLSTPITSTLGFRAVAYGMSMNGWMDNHAPVISSGGNVIAYGPETAHGNKQDQLFFRGTLLFRPNSDFTARLKYNYSHRSGGEPSTTVDRLACPNGAAQTLGLPTQVDNCKFDNQNFQGLANPILINNGATALPLASTNNLPLFPSQYYRGHQHLASVEMNYVVAPDVTLSSISGFYKFVESYRSDVSYQPAAFVFGGADVDRREISQEIRLSTAKKDWPVNFTVGGFYQDTKLFNGAPQLFDAYAFTRTLPLGTVGTATYNSFWVNSKAYSFFGQAIWNITDRIELAGGARWSHEQRDLDILAANRTVNGGIPVRPNIPVTRVKFNDTSPEVTLSYRPSRTLSFFAGFRNGFKSGGFNTGTIIPGTDVSYKPEDVRGYEVGAKAIIGDFRVNVTAYTYKYEGLQVSTFDPVRLVQTVLNAGAARVQGIEFDGNWRPRSVPGLELRGALNYNDAKYINFQAGCYTGQTQAAGCNLLPNAAGVARLQDLSRRPLSLAAKITGNAGFSYGAPLSNSLKFTATGDVDFSSSFFAQLEQAPLGKQRGYAFLNASLRISDQNDRWELALIGQNLTDTYRAFFVSQSPLTGISSRTGTTTEGGLSDLTGQVPRGRQVRLQATVHFN